MIKAAATPTIKSALVPNRLRRIVSLDVGSYELALDANDLLGIRDMGQITEHSPSAKSLVGRLVRVPEGDVRAIDLRGLLGIPSPTERLPLVLIRTSGQDDVPNQISPPLGLFVDSPSRPQLVSDDDWFSEPQWVRQGMVLPCQAFAIQRDRSGNEKIRMVLDASGFSATGSQNASSDSGTGNQFGFQDFGPQSSSRGLMVFAPAESSRAIQTAISIPMSFLVGVERSAVLRDFPSNDPYFAGVTIWKGRPISVLRLGDALGLSPKENETDSTSGYTESNESSPLLVIRTPKNEIFGCLASEQIRSLRTPKTTGCNPDCGIDPSLLLGSFMTTEGPLAVPDLDLLLYSTRTKV